MPTREQWANRRELEMEHPEYLSQGPRPQERVDPRPYIAKIREEMAQRKLSKQFGGNNV